MFHQNDAQPQNVKIPSKKFEEPVWEKITHPPYSHDLASSNYHLFSSLQNYLDRLTLKIPKKIKTEISEFSSKLKDFLLAGLKNL